MINKPAISPANGPVQPTVAFAWQEEVTALRKNYMLLDLLLRESALLPAATLAQYRSLQQLLLNTMEQFLADLDRLDDSDARQHPAAQRLLGKHATTMKQLNRYAESVTKAFRA